MPTNRLILISVRLILLDIYRKTFGGLVENVYLSTKSRYENVLKEYESKTSSVVDFARRHFRHVV